MRPVSGSWAAAVVDSLRTPASRLTVLTSELQPVEQFVGGGSVLLGGSASMSRTNETRRVSRVELMNRSGALSPRAASDLFYLGRLYQLEAGLWTGGVSGGTEWVSLGVYMVSEPEVIVTGAGSTITMQGSDRTRLAQYSGFTEPYSVEVGVPVAQAVLELAQAAGMGASSELYSLDDGGQVLGITRTWEEGTYRLPAMMQLAADHGLELFVDAVGVLTLRPEPLPDELPVVWEFASGEDAILLGLTRRLSDTDPGLFNHTTVVGASAGTSPVRGEARDLNPSSPLYNPLDGSGPFGDRLAPVRTSALITTPEQAEDVAQHLLAEVALVGEQITLPIVPNYALEPGDRVRVVQELAGVNDTYRLDTLEVPLAGSMVLGSKQVRSLSA